MIKRNKTMQREVSKKNQAKIGKENADGKASGSKQESFHKEKDEKSMRCEQSTMVLTDKTNN